MPTRDEISTIVRVNLNDLGVTFYSADDVNDALQDGYDDIAVFSGCIQKTANLTLLDNTVYYDIPAAISDFFAVVAAYNNNSNRWLEFQPLKHFDGVRIDWELWTGEPLFGSISNFRYLAFIPHQVDAVGTITIWYRALAPVLSGSTVPLIHTDEQDLLELYATADLLDQAEEYTKADSYWEQYFTRLMAYKKRVASLATSDYLPVLGGSSVGLV